MELNQYSKNSLEKSDKQDSDESFEVKKTFNRNVRYKWRVFDQEKNGQNQTRSYRETVQMSTLIKIDSTFSDCQDFDSRIETNSFSWQWFASN